MTLDWQVLVVAFVAAWLRIVACIDGRVVGQIGKE